MAEALKAEVVLWGEWNCLRKLRRYLSVLWSWPWNWRLEVDQTVVTMRNIHLLSLIVFFCIKSF